MPSFFLRMAESFARNPANGFQTFLQELADLEEPALEGVTLSRDEERRAGRRALEEYLRRARARGYSVVSDDDRRVAYLRGLVRLLAPRMTHRERYPEIDVTLIDAPVADGHSFPGGFLVFTTALLEEPDEAVVAGVVAHELAHLDLGHLYGYARRGKLAEATYSRPPGAGAGFDQFFTRQMALFGLLMNPYRPGHEIEADCVATTWMFLGGYDPEALVEFFERLHLRLRDRPMDAEFALGRSHPYTLDRRTHVRQRLEQLRRWRPDTELGRHPENLRRLTPREPAKAGTDPLQATK
jgi:predicted Zn-dependent protease